MTLAPNSNSLIAIKPDNEHAFQSSIYLLSLTYGHSIRAVTINTLHATVRSYRNERRPKSYCLFVPQEILRQNKRLLLKMGDSETTLDGLCLPFAFDVRCQSPLDFVVHERELYITLGN